MIVTLGNIKERPVVNAISLRRELELFMEDTGITKKKVAELLWCVHRPVFSVAVFPSLSWLTVFGCPSGLAPSLSLVPALPFFVKLI